MSTEPANSTRHRVTVEQDWYEPYPISLEVREAAGSGLAHVVKVT